MRLRASLLLAGIAALEAAILLPADSLSAHVISHALVAVVAAPLLVLAAPLGVALRPLSPPAGGASSARCGGPLGSPAAPVAAWAAFIAAHWAALLVAGTQHHVTGLGHLGLHAMLLVAGVLFWLPVLGRGQAGAAAARAGRGPLPVPGDARRGLTAVWLMAGGRRRRGGHARGDAPPHRRGGGLVELDPARGAPRAGGEAAR